MPHSTPELVADGPLVVATCLSKIRQMISTQVHTPAAVITPPSPPGRWNARPSALWNSKVRTEAATSRTAASTNEKAPQPVIVTLADWSFALWARAIRVTWYQGRNSVRNSPIDANAASCDSCGSARQARTRRVVPDPTRRAAAVGASLMPRL